MKQKQKSKKNKLKVLYVGNFDSERYTRGRVLYKGLLRNNVNVNLVLGNNLKGYFHIAKTILKRDYDIILATGKPTVLISLFLRMFHRKKIVFDAFISDYENLVLNRKLVKKHTIKSKLIWLLDKYSCKFSDLTLLDTLGHVEYFCKEYNLKNSLFRVIVIGADEKRFFPVSKGKKDSKFKVLFAGTFIIGHGIDVMLKSAKLLEDEKNIEFILIGDGQIHKEMVTLSEKLDNKNVKFLGWVDQKKLPDYVTSCDVSLGVFDKNIKKVNRLLSTKMFEVMAMKKPFLTGNTSASRKYAKDGENIILCEMSSSPALAGKIKKLYKNKKYAEKISKKGYDLFRKKYSATVLGLQLKKIIEELL